MKGVIVNGLFQFIADNVPGGLDAVRREWIAADRAGWIGRNVPYCGLDDLRLIVAQAPDHLAFTWIDVACADSGAGPTRDHPPPHRRRIPDPGSRLNSLLDIVHFLRAEAL